MAATVGLDLRLGIPAVQGTPLCRELMHVSSPFQKILSVRPLRHTLTISRKCQISESENVLLSISIDTYSCIASSDFNHNF